MSRSRAPRGSWTRRTIGAIVDAALVLVWAPAAHALPGDLDPTFSGDGLQVTR